MCIAPSPSYLRDVYLYIEKENGMRNSYVLYYTYIYISLRPIPNIICIYI